MLIYFDKESRQYILNKTELYAVSEFREIMEKHGQRHMTYFLYWVRWGSPFYHIEDPEKKDRLICAELNAPHHGTQLPIQKGFYKDKVFTRAANKYDELELDTSDPDYLALKYMTRDLTEVLKQPVDRTADNWASTYRSKGQAQKEIRGAIKDIMRENKSKLDTFGVGTKAAADAEYGDIDNEDDIDKAETNEQQ